MAEGADAAFKQAIEILEDPTVLLDPDAPSCDMWRLRPSEEAAILIERFLNPPPRWGKRINLASMFLGPEKCIAIGRKLILNRTVTTLNLSMCDMQEEAAVNFFSCIKRNRCLKHLNVNGNNIGDIGAIAAAECICNLETLHVSCNNIHDKGALAIASALRGSTKIKTLNLRANRITAYGAYKLISSLEPIVHRVSTAVREVVTALDSPVTTDSDASWHVMPRAVVQENLLVSGERKGERSGRCSLQGEEDTVAPSEMYNETIQTFWLRFNCDIPEELFKILDTILAKRFSQLPKGIPKKKISAKSKGK